MKPDEPPHPHGADPMLDCFRDHVAEFLRRAKNGSDLKAATSMAHNQLDAAFSKALAESGRKIACGEGCSYCCYLKVDASPVEVFIVVDYIRKRFTEQQRQEVLAAARSNAEKIKPLTYTQHEIANLPCPLLKDARCSVYPVRPGLCRIMHSTDVGICKMDFEHPEKSNSTGFIGSVRATTASAHVGTHDAYAEAEYDTLAYDLNAALAEALGDSKSEKRWRDKKAAFPQSALAKDVIERRDARKRGL